MTLHPPKILLPLLLAVLGLSAAAGAQIQVTGDTYFPAADNPGDPAAYGTIEIDYTVSQDFAPGGRIRVFFGYTWEDRTVEEPRAKGWSKLQVERPEEDSFCTVSSASRSDLALVPIDIVPYGFRLVPTDAENPLSAGDVIRFVIGDTSQGGPGYRVSPQASSIQVLIQERATPFGQFVNAYPGSEYPRLRVGGTAARRFRVTADSMPLDTANIPLKVVALDQPDSFVINGPVVEPYTGTITFECDDPAVELPADYTFTPADGGVADFTVAAAARRPFSVTVRDTSVSNVFGVSNRVLPVGPGNHLLQERVFWGSLHNHTSVGGHGLETPEFAYEYARHVADLDFFSLSEHSSLVISKGMFDWDVLKHYGEAYTVPEEFIGFSGFEWTNHNLGHRHVVYKNAEEIDAVVTESADGSQNVFAPSLEGLLRDLRGKEAIAIPHHSAWQAVDMRWGGKLDSAVQPLVEIYSWHGSSECWDTPLPMHGHPGYAHPEFSGTYVQEALRAGYRFGFTADSDNHLGRPGSAVGQRHLPDAQRYSRMGITGVYAPELTRDAIWDALVHRRTFATTGARILAWLWVDGHFVGEEYLAGSARTIRVQVEGSDILDLVEVLDGNRVIYSVSPLATSAEITFVDDRKQPGKTHAYYVRVRQIGILDPTQLDPHYAWVSPVWAVQPPAHQTDPVEERPVLGH